MKNLFFALVAVFAFHTFSFAQSVAGVNLAKGKVAHQIYTDYGGTANKAVDGNTNGNFHDGSVTHTTSVFQPWWKVDLGQTYDINEVKLFNRTDAGAAGSERLKNVVIMVSDVPFTSVTAGAVFEEIDMVPAAGGTYKGNQRGRYLLVYLKDTGILSLAEVEVYGIEAVRKNLAEGKVAHQIYTDYGGTANKAVDGNTNGNFHDGSVTHTTSVFQPWWKVDLGQTYDIAEVKLFNRTDAGTAGSERLKNVVIMVSDVPFTSVTAGAVFEEIDMVPATGGTYKGNQRGRYLLVYLKDTGILSLAEVEVYAK